MNGDPKETNQILGTSEKTKREGIASIKPEFLLHENISIKDNNTTPKQVAEPKSQDATNEEPPKKKLKGQNKKRPRDPKIPKSEKLCFKFLSETKCPFGEKCTYSHDIASFMKKKPADVGSECYLYNNYGKCEYGLNCRYGSGHITESYENKVNDELWQKNKDTTRHINNLSRDLQISLRSRKYDFERTKKTLAEIDIIKEKRLAEKNNAVSLSEDKSTNEQSTTIGEFTDEEKVKTRPTERKKIDFSDKLYLAPLTTVGNLPFRRICKEFGADITCGEMAICSNILQGTQSEWALLRRHQSEDFFGIQVCGAHPDMMTRCAQVIDENINVDFVDINMGCPIDLVYQKGAGSGLMGKSTKFHDIIHGMSSILSVPLTIKIRTGIYENKHLADTLISKLKQWGSEKVALITLHGRSREQRYTKFADWDYVSKCASLAKPISFFGNGDILSYEDHNSRKESSNVSGIMIARGALIKPWIFTEIKEQRHWDISSNERLDILRKYANFGLEYWGSDTQGVEKTRRFLLEWLSFLHRYIPVGVLERVPQRINERPPFYFGRNDLETLMISPKSSDWVEISELLLGPVPDNFQFLPKHKANSYS